MEVLPPPDKTLTQEGFPSDAKAVGDALNEKLDKTGGVVTGLVDFAVPGANNMMFVKSTNTGDYDNFIRVMNTTYNADIGIGIGLGKYLGIFDFKNAHWIINGEADTKNIYIGGQFVAGVVDASGDNWIRFSEGTQICWTTDLVGSSNTVWIFPVAFLATPAVSFQAIGASSELLDVVGGNVITTTQASCFGWRNTGNNFAPYSVQAIAIGRWK